MGSNRTPMMEINLTGDGIWPDLTAKVAAGQVLPDPIKWSVSSLPEGMMSGRPSVTFRFDLPSGQVLLAETSARMILTLAAALKGKYGALVE